MSVARFFDGWQFVNQALIDVIAPLDRSELGILINKDWPIWASVSHLAGTRAYWLCHIFKEPGVETTPFQDPTGMGWEDDLAHPRSAAELVGALECTFRIIDHTLRTWTPESLGQTARRPRGDQVQIHTRQSVLFRMITHDAFHAGEISLALGQHGLGSGSPGGAVDLWQHLSRLEGATE